MKKVLVLIFLGFILSGCATYKFQKPATSGAEGYLVCYNNEPVLEYTVGKEKSLPDLALAKERFKRRKTTVEYYYKEMGQLESRLKEVFWDTPMMLVDFLKGILRWPFVAIADYKYNRNPEYREKVDKLDEQKDKLEKDRVNALKGKLAAYIIEELGKEPFPQGVVVTAPVASKPEPAKVAPKAKIPVFQEATPQPMVVELPEKNKPIIVEAPATERVLEPPVAVIIAKPVKGYSPLTVKFSGQKSYSKSGKIVAYDWNFGDGDTSIMKNPENTYWSTTFGSRNFTVTLTVRDDTGSSSSATAIIEVSTL